jgi:hypothetical protein
MNARLYQILNLVGLIGVLTMNYLANALPLGGRTTGELSDQYPSLITPAGLTFSIWGVIYLLLIVFAIRQARGLFNSGQAPPDYVGKIGGWFFVNALLNMAWLFAWHYQRIPLSLLIMLGILGSLLIIYQRLGIGANRQAARSERNWVWPAFSIYLGWITVATIVNVSVFLLDAGWGGWGLTPEAWTIVMLIISVAIGLLILFRRGDLWYNVVLIWAYIGILLKQTAPPGDYVSIGFTALGLAVVLLVVSIVVVIRRRGIYQ